MENQIISQNIDELIAAKIPAFVNELKAEYEPIKSLCRCCLSENRPTKDVMSFRAYFTDLAGLNVSRSDGLPQRICYECIALLHKSVRFKQKMTRANAVLLDYLSRCAPFSIDTSDPELIKYSSPHLNKTDTLVIDCCGNDTKTYQGITRMEHKKNGFKSKLETIQASLSHTIAEVRQSVKQEIDFEDYDDNITLEQYRTAKLSLEDASIGSITQDDLDQILHQQDTAAADRDTNTNGKAKGGRRKKHHKDRLKRKVKRAKNSIPTEDSIPKEKSSIRKQIDLDPNKIREITLNPEEQIKQREEESKTNLKYPFKCHLCYKGFNFEAKLQNHMAKHSPSRGVYECTLCHMYLPTAYSHSVHSRIHNRRYQCVICHVTMIDRNSIVTHYQSQHEGIVSTYKCQICGKVSNNYKTHRGHMRNHHSGERPTCDQCGKSFVNKDSLAEHIQIHQGVKNYECSVCKKRFRTRTQIKQHQLKHTDVKQFYCVECDVRFKSEHNLRQHLLRSNNHKDKNSFKFPCERCGKRYENAASLSHHVSVTHDGVRAHACAVCGAALATKNSLQKHIARVHAGQRRPAMHQCHTCGRAFAGKSVLVNHVRTHTGEKPYECNTCGRKFTQRSAMVTHHKLVHLKLRRSDKITVEVASREDAKQDPIFPKEEAPLFDGYFFVPLNAHQP